MAIFNRGENGKIREYIYSTDSVSRPMALVLTAIIFVIAAAVAFTLFWAGKWAYDRLTKDNSGTITQTSSQRTGSPATVPSPTPTPSATPKPSPTPTANGLVPNTGPNEIPNTGPQPE